jgi:hypothetical protein
LLISTGRARERIGVVARVASLAFVAALLAAASPLGAAPGAISLQITASARQMDGAAIVDVSVANVGDERADSLQVHVDFDSMRRSGTFVSRLEAGDTVDEEIVIEALDVLPGRHPVIISVEYADANDYPLSAISYVELIVGEDRAPALAASLESIDLAETGELVLRVTNLGERAREVQARLVLPRELVTDLEDRTLSLGGLESRTETLNVRNQTALSPSTYPVFALLEYREDGHNTCVFVAATIRVVDREPASIDFRGVALIAVPLLLLAVILLQLRSRLQRAE